MAKKKRLTRGHFASHVGSTDGSFAKVIGTCVELVRLSEKPEQHVRAFVPSLWIRVSSPLSSTHSEPRHLTFPGASERDRPQL